jgi:hypothetical protein
MFSSGKQDRRKKKGQKRKRSEEENLETNEGIEKIDMTQLNSHIPEQKEIKTVLDVKERMIELYGSKGHSTHYSEVNILFGTFYFEVTVRSLEYNMVEFLNLKRADEFSKKYYDIILQDLKPYQPCIRVGLLNNKGDLAVPVGTEAYSYGYRSSDGSLINDGEYTLGNNTFYTGDTIGILVHLKPPMPEFLKKEKNLQFSDKNIDCYINFYLNGVLQKQSFKGISEGSYHAAVTLYNFSQAMINFGPNFKYPNIEENRNVKAFYDA